MLKLALVGPAWEELFPANGNEPAVKAQFDPITIKAVRAARRAVAAAFREDRDDAENAGDAMSRELIRRGLRAWAGIGDDKGNPIAPTDLFPVMDDNGEPVVDAQGAPVMQSALDMFIADPRTFEAADRVYVMPWVKRDLEGNASSASPAGIGEAETPADDTASSPAGTPTADDASPTTTTPIGSAPISSSSPKPKKAPRSGKSSRAARPSSNTRR